MNFLNIILLVIGLETFAMAAGQPIYVGGDDAMDACWSLGKVAGLKKQGDGFLSVREGPSTEARETGRLANGQEALICDENEQWFAIVYSKKSKGKPLTNCGVSSPIAVKRIYSGPCQSGWVSKKWIRIIAG